MFKVTLLNVGSNMVSKDFITSVDTLQEAVIVSRAECVKFVSIPEFIVKDLGNNVYGLMYADIFVGSFTIMAL